MTKTVVVVPTCRESSIIEFLQAWDMQLASSGFDVVLFVVEDQKEPTFDLAGCVHFSHQDIERDLGSDAWIIPRYTDCVRSYGLWRAWREQSDMIVTMDDDVRPIEGVDFLVTHYNRLNTEARGRAWVSTIEGAKPRGIPYRGLDRCWPVVLNHGLWRGDADLDAITELTSEKRDINLLDGSIPRGQYFPMCGMNLAWKPKITPALYFGLQGGQYPFDRFGDIWAGLFVKRICDHLGMGVLSGVPHIHHQRASDVWANLHKEYPGVVVNEWLWKQIDDAPLRGRSIVECYHELAYELACDGEYWDKLKQAMHIWASLFE